MTGPLKGGYTYELVGGPEDGRRVVFSTLRAYFDVLLPEPTTMGQYSPDPPTSTSIRTGRYVAGWWGDEDSDTPRERVMTWIGE